MNQPRIFLDYASTTPVDPRVLDKMLPYFSQKFGNPSSIHYFGQEADSAIEDAREKVALLLNCNPKEIIFTSGGSESDNLAIRGTAFAARIKKNASKILISPVEHQAVTKTAIHLSKYYGFEVEFLPVDRYGLVNPEEVAKRLGKHVALVSIIYANNEIGTINPIKEIGEICRSFDVPFHTDAVQAGGYLSVDVNSLNVDLASFGAHKFYGPKGVGVLYIRHGIPILSMNTGGGQEYGLRAGTHNVPYIVGFAEALQIAQEERETRSKYLISLRDHLIGKILEEIPNSQLTGHPTLRLPNHSSFVFKDIDGNALLTLLDIAGYACSSGSACKSGNPEPSEVLTALGYPREWALGSLRVTMGNGTSPDHINSFLTCLVEKFKQLRSTSFIR